MNYPLISIIIATFNSAGTLSKTLQSINKQTYPRQKVEVLVIDGRSQDNTRKIAKQFGLKVIDNPQIGFIPAKHLGFVKAKGKYVMYLDSDEEIENPDDFKKKVAVFLKNEKVKGVISTGYKNPPHFSPISHYINEFGDPFSYFVYGEGMNAHFFIPRLKKMYIQTKETTDYIQFNFSKSKVLPLIELVAMGCMIDLAYVRKKFPEIKKNPQLVTHFFYFLNQQYMDVAVIKKSPIIHYSAATIKTYLSKISWRIRNNIYNKQSIGQAGFEGRDRFQPVWFRLKRYLFIPYSYSFFWPLWDGIYLSVTRKDPIFLIHPFLCIYASSLILYYYFLYLVGKTPEQRKYGA